VAKRKNTISKHDIIRAVRSINARVGYLENMISSLSEMFREYVSFMDNEDGYLEHLDKKSKEEEEKLKDDEAVVEKLDDEEED
jgi:hypothetical protein